MNDLEICKRLAEIEGEFTKCKDWAVNMCAQLKFGDGATWKIYNPLTDKALCFDLMIKHNIELTPMFSGCWCATVVKTYTFDEQVDYKLCPSWVDDDPQKAVCLAIIEANEDKNKTTWLRDSNTHSNKGK